jgi:DNA primase
LVRASGCSNTAEAVGEAVPIEEIAHRYTEIKPLGGKAWFTGRCPLPDHDDSDPSFYIYPPGRYWCYGCGRGGDVVDLEFFCGGYGELWEAMAALAVEFGVELPSRSKKWHQWQREKLTIEDLAERVRFGVRCRRLFKLMILSSPEIQNIENLAERREEVRRCW